MAANKVWNNLTPILCTTDLCPEGLKPVISSFIVCWFEMLQPLVPFRLGPPSSSIEGGRAFSFMAWWHHSFDLEQDRLVAASTVAFAGLPSWRVKLGLFASVDEAHHLICCGDQSFPLFTGLPTILMSLSALRFSGRLLYTSSFFFAGSPFELDDA